jgi:excisionase family DNA binding protein
VEKLLYRIEEVVILTGLSRATLFREMAEGKLRVVKIGRSTRITADELYRYVDVLKAAAGLPLRKESP